MYYKQLMTNLPVIASHEAPVHQVAFSPDGRRFATADVERNVRVWQNAEMIFDVNLRAQNEKFKAVDVVRGLAFEQSGTLLLTASADVFRAWDLATHELVWEQQSPPTYWFLQTNAEALAAKGPHFAVAYANGKVHLWKVMRQGDGWHFTQISRWSDNEAPVSMTFMSDEEDLRLLGTDRHSVCVWDARTGATLLRTVPDLKTHAVAASPTHNVIAVRSLYSTVVYDLETLQPISEVKTRPGLPTLAFSHTDRLLAMGHEHGVTVVDFEGRVTDELTTEGVVTISMQFLPHVNQLAIGGSDGLVRLWEELRKPQAAALS